MYGNTTASLDLTSNTAHEAMQILKPGRHICICRKAEIKQGTSSQTINLTLDEINGVGMITARLNVWAQNAEAQRISRDQLKAYCTFGGHPNPNKPLLAGVEKLAGYAVGVVVGEGKPYTKDGKNITPTEVKGFFKLEGADAVAAVAALQKMPRSTDPFKAAQDAQAPLQDDEIPF